MGSIASPGQSSGAAAARVATRLSFLVAGFGLSCWAPLVPLAKQRLGVDDRELGLVLLCLGVGSVAALLFTGAACARLGSRPVILAGGVGMTLMLPLLAVVGTPAELAVVLLIFGASLGALDAAMNVHAVEVEKAAGRPLMSGFHALFSIGGFAGSGVMTALLVTPAGPAWGACACAVLMAAGLAVARPRLWRVASGTRTPMLVVPRGLVLLLAGLAGIAFLVEGAVLDWGALIVAELRLAGDGRGGLGFTMFSMAMTAGRLGGDAVTARLGEGAVLRWGSIGAVLGLAVLLCVPLGPVAMGGFVLVGLGLSNLVPVLFRRAGSQRAMPPELAVAAITTTGYAGILLGPAAIGLVAGEVGLAGALWMLAGLLCVFPLTASAVAAGSSGAQRSAARRPAPWFPGYSPGPNP